MNITTLAITAATLTTGIMSSTAPHTRRKSRKNSLVRAHTTPGYTPDDSEEIKSKLEKALNASKVYYGDIVIIGGDRVTYGNDEGEIIIEDAVVIATI